MTQKNCNCMHQCNGECPMDISCPLDSIPFSSQKNRSTSRNRYHNNVREKNETFSTSEILAAKAKKLSANAFYEEEKKACQRAEAALKKSQKFKKQIKEREELHTKRSPKKDC